MINGWFIQKLKLRGEERRGEAAHATTRGLVCTVLCCEAGEQTGGEGKSTGEGMGGY